MALHCLRDAVNTKPELMTENADSLIEKVSCSFNCDYFHRSILLRISYFNRNVLGVNGDAREKNSSKISQVN